MKRNPPTIVPTTEDLIYAAGLFDGEGSVTITTEKVRVDLKTNRRSPAQYLSVNVVQTNERLVGWFRNRFGGSICVSRAFKPTNLGKRPVWKWSTTTGGAEEFLRKILPWLRLKFTQALIGIVFNNGPRCEGGPVPETWLLWRNELRHTIRALNKGLVPRSPEALRQQGLTP